MSESKENSLNMAAELFTKPEQNREFLLPPKSKEEYIEDLESPSSPHDIKVFSLKCLVEAYRFGGLNNGGRYTEEGCNELIVLLQKYGKDIHLQEHVASTLALFISPHNPFPCSLTA